VRALLLGLVTAVLAACAQPHGAQQPSSAVTPESTHTAVDPGRIKRVRSDMPSGYEVADAVGVASPAEVWGFRTGLTAEPPQCATLVDPTAGGSALGLSGSGDGGLLYVVVVPGVATLDPVLTAQCPQWQMAYGSSSATAELVPAPHIEGVDTVGMSATIRTVVESGRQTEARAQTFSGYLGQCVVFVTLVVDPASPHPPLPPQTAADLLVKSVAALRG